MLMEYDWQEVEKHRYKHDCWMVVEKNVYDITQFINKHPGGDILFLCGAGRDATALIYTTHFRDIRSLLHSYLIGKLKKECHANPKKYEYYHSTFKTILDKRVFDFFKTHHIDPRHSVFCLFKAMFFILSSIFLYALSINYFEHFLQIGIIIGLITGLCLAATMMNIMHDSCHGAFSKYPAVNKIMRYIMDLQFGSSYIWIMTHNPVHHIYPNVKNIDCDGETSVNFIRFKPYHRFFKKHRFQHIYLFLIYSMHLFAWPINDLIQIVTGKATTIRLYKYGKLHIPLDELIIFILTRIISVFLFIALPMLFIGFLKTVLLFVIVRMSEGYMLAWVIASQHHNMSASFFDETPAEGWAEGILKSTLNVNAFSKIFGFVSSFFTGGCNYHIEHHLYPTINHCHLQKISPIVQKTCREFGLEYHNVDSYPKLFLSHWKYIRLQAQQNVV